MLSIWGRKEQNEPASDEQVEVSSKAMGYRAVKNADPKNYRLSNYKFSYAQSERQHSSVIHVHICTNL